MHRCVLDWAAWYRSVGVSVVPVRRGGSKAPAMARDQIQQYRDRLPTEKELSDWFDVAEPPGLAAVCGAASGNLAVLDFECRDSDGVYYDWLRSLPPEVAEWCDRMPLVETPSGGRHLWVRLPDCTPSGKLAKYADGKTKIEIKGAGGYVLAPGSPPECHQTGREYEFLRKGWLS